MSKKLTNEEFDNKIKDFQIKRIGDYNGNKNKILFKCKLCGKEFFKKPSDVSNSNNGKYGCPSCAKNHGTNELRKRKGISNEKLDDIVKKFKIKRIEDISGKTSRDKILFKCEVCGKKFYQIYNVVKNGHGKYGCPSCSEKLRGKKLRLTEEDVINRLNMKNIKLLEDYKGSHKYHKLKCTSCGYIWVGNLTSYLHGKINHGCPICDNLNIGGEKIMIEILNKYHINYESQKTFNNMKDSIKLRFDFYLKDYNIVIEIDGEQHYRCAKFSQKITDEEAQHQFEILQKHDEIKNNYCMLNHIRLIRIPYKVNKKYTNISKIINFETMESYFIQILKLKEFEIL